MYFVRTAGDHTPEDLRGMAEWLDQHAPSLRQIENEIGTAAKLREAAAALAIMQGVMKNQGNLERLELGFADLVEATHFKLRWG